MRYPLTLRLLSAGAALSARAGAGAASFAPGNVLISTNEVLSEYTTAGQLVQSFDVPDASGQGEQARDLAIDRDGRAHVYNGTFEPYLSSLEPSAGAWDHRTFLGWSTVNNGSYGGIDAFGSYVFVTDMRTFGQGDKPQGVVRFDLEGGDATRFAEDIEPIDLDVGLDGLLYALYPGGSPEGRMIDVYDPETLAFVRTIDLSAIFGHTGHRSIGVDVAGDIFVADWDGELQRVSAGGELVDAIDLNDHGLSNLHDVDVAPGGVIAVGDRFGRVAITDADFAGVSTFTVGSSSTFVHLVPSGCSADVDGSGAVDFGDVLAILGAWGAPGGPEDLDGSGTVGFGDLLIVLAEWGPCA